MEHKVVIRDGRMEFVYSDDLVSLTNEGAATITRASHVEPHPRKPGWVSDMGPSAGPVLGRNGAVLRDDAGREHFECRNGSRISVADPWAALDGFETRQAALDAEREWLREHRGL